LVPDETFALTHLAIENDRVSAPNRWFLLALSIFMGVVGVIGVGLLLREPRSGHGYLDTVEAAILVLAGGLLSAYILTIYLTKRSTPRRLVIGAGGLFFTGRPRGKPIELGWDNRNFYLLVYDFRALYWAPTNRPRMPADFYIQPRLGPQTPIPPDAFDAILREVQSHGLRVVGDPSPPDSPGGVKTITIRKASKM